MPVFSSFGFIFPKIPMELSSSQIGEFEERGFLFFPELLKSYEVKLLTDHLEGLYSRTGPEVVREKTEPAYD